MGTIYCADHILVQLQPGITEQKLAELNKKHGAKIRKKMTHPGMYLVEFDDVTLVQKFAVIVIGFLGLLNLNDELGITS